jgi:hypothetical protein
MAGQTPEETLMANGDLNPEGLTYHAAIARIALAVTVEEARALAREALRIWRAGPPHGALALHAIATERRRQIQGEGWTEEHDDEHDAGELAAAAACYAMNAADRLHPYSQGDGASMPGEAPPAGWPFDVEHWKPGGPDNALCDLVKAGALILAEIERIYRARRRCQACGAIGNEAGYISHKDGCPVDKPRPVAP